MAFAGWDHRKLNFGGGISLPLHASTPIMSSVPAEAAPVYHNLYDAIHHQETEDTDAQILEEAHGDMDARRSFIDHAHGLRSGVIGKF